MMSRRWLWLSLFLLLVFSLAATAILSCDDDDDDDDTGDLPPVGDDDDTTDDDTGDDDNDTGDDDTGDDDTGDDDTGDDDTGDDDTTAGPSITDITHGTCKNGAGPTEDDWPEDLTFAYEGGVLTVTHVNGWFNCCLESIEVEMEISGATIDLYEEEYAPDPCYCICPYDVVTDIAGLDDDTYTVNVYVNGDLSISDEVTIP